MTMFFVLPGYWKGKNSLILNISAVSLAFVFCLFGFFLLCFKLLLIHLLLFWLRLPQNQDYKRI